MTVNRTLDTIYLSVDGIDSGQATTPGTYHDLNIDLGLALGGSADLDLDTDFPHELKSFRGCLSDVFFNTKDVLQEAERLKTAQNAFQVSWHCDDIFSASPALPLSLSTQTSFVAFPYLRMYPETGGSISCDVKTRSLNAIVLFNSGTGSASQDFIALELVGGKPKLSVDKGSGLMQVLLDYFVSDGRWHRIEISVSDSEAKVQVDLKTNVSRFHFGGPKFLNLAGEMFVGGVGIWSRLAATRLGLVTLQGDNAMTGSLVGCVTNITMNSRRYR